MFDLGKATKAAGLFRNMVDQDKAQLEFAIVCTFYKHEYFDYSY